MCALRRTRHLFCLAGERCVAISGAVYRSSGNNLSSIFVASTPLIYIRAGYVYRSNVLHMLLLHHIITRLALLNLVTRQSRKLLQRYNSISGKSKSIRLGSRTAHVCRRNENVRGCDVIRLSLSKGNYALLINNLLPLPMYDIATISTLRLIYVCFNRH